MKRHEFIAGITALPLAARAQQPAMPVVGYLEMVINLKTAKALDLTVPPNLLAVADELIE